MGRTCKKCGYTRLETDEAPSEICPHCGAVYAKVDAYLARKAAEEAKQQEEKAQAQADAAQDTDKHITTSVLQERPDESKAQPAPRMLLNEVDAPHVKTGLPVNEGNPGLTNLLYLLSAISLLSGLILAVAFWPEEPRYKLVAAAYVLPITWIIAGVVNFAIFAAMGYALALLKTIARNTETYKASIND
jgi:uncharacterized Zn finger protein (UPF0148 family)